MPRIYVDYSDCPPEEMEADIREEFKRVGWNDQDLDDLFDTLRADEIDQLLLIAYLENSLPKYQRRHIK